MNQIAELSRLMVLAIADQVNGVKTVGKNSDYIKPKCLNSLEIWSTTTKASREGGSGHTARYASPAQSAACKRRKFMTPT